MSGLLIGHRGAAGYGPENTLAAFKKAHELGCRYIEFDVMLSADGEAFIFHDNTINRTTNAKGEFGLLNAEHIRTLDAGIRYSKRFRGEKIPTLRETIAWLSGHDMQANIEIKPYPGRIEQTTIAVLSHINQFWSFDKALPLVSSFELQALTLCRSLAPELPLGLLLHNWSDNGIQLAEELQCCSVHLNKRIASADRVALLKQQGFAVYVYTVNRKRQANKFFSWGVDAVFSDYPDLLL